LKKTPFPDDESNSFAKGFIRKLNGFSKALNGLSEDVNEAAQALLLAVINVGHACIVLITIWVLIKTVFAEVIRFAV
jgi:hypothetical protein